MYKTPKIKSELYDIPNTIGENNKAKADPSLPRKPDFPEVDVSELTETTIDKLSSREAAREDILNKFNSNRRNASATYPPPIVHNSEVVVYGLGEVTGVSDCWESAHTSVTRTVYGGHRSTFPMDQVTPGGVHLYRPKWVPTHTYYLYAGSAEDRTNYLITDYYVTDASLISQVNLVMGDRSQEQWIAYDGDTLQTGELILPFTQTYTNYTKINLTPNRGTIIEVVVGGRQKKTFAGMGTLNGVYFSSTEDAPDTNMPNPDDEGNYAVYSNRNASATGYDLIIKNYSVYPRLIRIEL